VKVLENLLRKSCVGNGGSLVSTSQPRPHSLLSHTQCGVGSNPFDLRLVDSHPTFFWSAGGGWTRMAFSTCVFHRRHGVHSTPRAY